MKTFLMIALFGAGCISTPAFAGQEQTTPGEFVRLMAQARVPTAAPRPPAAPATPAPQPAPAPPAAPAPPPAGPVHPPTNVRFDVTITDTGGPRPVVKVLSVTLSPSTGSGSIRNTAQIPFAPVSPAPPNMSQVMAVPLNVDVRQVNWVDTNALRATVTVEYQPYIPEAKSQPGAISASSNSIFYDGRKTQILVTSDPLSDRKTTIEVTATILK